MKLYICDDDAVTSVTFSPGYLHHFLNLPPREAWDMFGDIPLRTDGDLPENTARVHFESGESVLWDLNAPAALRR